MNPWDFRAGVGMMMPGYQKSAATAAATASARMMTNNHHDKRAFRKRASTTMDAVSAAVAAVEASRAAKRAKTSASMTDVHGIENRNPTDDSGAVMAAVAAAAAAAASSSSSSTSASMRFFPQRSAMSPMSALPGSHRNRYSRMIPVVNTNYSNITDGGGRFAPQPKPRKKTKKTKKKTMTKKKPRQYVKKKPPKPRSKTFQPVTRDVPTEPLQLPVMFKVGKKRYGYFIYASHSQKWVDDPALQSRTKATFLCVCFTASGVPKVFANMTGAVAHCKLLDLQDTEPYKALLSQPSSPQRDAALAKMKKRKTDNNGDRSMFVVTHSEKQTSSKGKSYTRASLHDYMTDTEHPGPGFVNAPDMTQWLVVQLTRMATSSKGHLEAAKRLEKAFLRQQYSQKTRQVEPQRQQQTVLLPHTFGFAGTKAKSAASARLAAMAAIRQLNKNDNKNNKKDTDTTTNTPLSYLGQTKSVFVAPAASSSFNDDLLGTPDAAAITDASSLSSQKVVSQMLKPLKPTGCREGRVSLHLRDIFPARTLVSLRNTYRMTLAGGNGGSGSASDRTSKVMATMIKRGVVPTMVVDSPVKFLNLQHPF